MDAVVQRNNWGLTMAVLCSNCQRPVVVWSRAMLKKARGNKSAKAPRAISGHDLCQRCFEQQNAGLVYRQDRQKLRGCCGTPQDDGLHLTSCVNYQQQTTNNAN